MSVTELQQLPPWLAPLANRLQGLHQEQRLPHAMLIAGPPGWGQTELAQWLAVTLLGIESELDITDVAHPDLRWIVPDGAVIKVDQVRALAQFAVGTRQSAAYKVAVLEQAHGLNEQAANALLKTLEEPPAGTLLILATEYASRLLPTIRSRCQRFDIRPDQDAGAAWLESNYGSAVSELAFEYGNAPLAVAQAMAREEVPLAPALSAGLAGRSGQLHEALLAQDNATVLLRWLRYLLAELAGNGRLAPLQGQAPRTVLDFAQELLVAQRQFVSSNSVNHRLQLERLSLRFAALPQVS